MSNARPPKIIALSPPRSYKSHHEKSLLFDGRNLPHAGHHANLLDPLSTPMNRSSPEALTGPGSGVVPLSFALLALLAGVIPISGADGQWPIWRHDGGITGHQPLPGAMKTEPRVLAKYFVGTQQ